MAGAAAQSKLLAVIGDEDTCVGFLLGGIGEYNKKRDPNFLVVDKNTSVQEIEDCYKKFVKRPDIDIILINQNLFSNAYSCVKGRQCILSLASGGERRDASRRELPVTVIPVAEQIRHVIDANDSALPAVLEIPSKDHPYDPAKDSVLRRAKGLYSADDMR